MPLKPARLLFFAALLLGTPAQADESDKYVQSLATEYGLTLRQFDEKGNPASLDAGPIGKHVIAYKGTPVFVETDSYVDFMGPLYELKDEKLVLVSISSGGNACGATYVLISLKNGAATPTKPFGNCSEPEIFAHADNVEFRFYDGYGKRLIETYKNGALAESHIALPLGSDPNYNGRDFNFLANYTSRDDVEKILVNGIVVAVLNQIMGTEAEMLKERLSAMGDPEIHDNFIILQGAMPHAFTMEEGFLALSLTDTAVYAAILTTTGEKKKTITAYTNFPHGSAAPTPPAPMQSWLESHDNVNMVWVASKP